MKPIDILFLAGCVSPIDYVPHGMIVYQVGCAELVYMPVGNPYKIVQEQNVIIIPAPRATAERSSLCGSKRAVWYVKKGKRKYRCR